MSKFGTELPAAAQQFVFLMNPNVVHAKFPIRSGENIRCPPDLEYSSRLVITGGFAGSHFLDMGFSAC